jgi:hypothetical protein
MIMFFQISAATGGMTKKGEITRMRTMPCPKIGWSISSAIDAADDGDDQHAADQRQRVPDRQPEGRVGHRNTGS